MSNPVDFIDKMNQAIYGDDWTMEKAQKALNDLCGIPDILLGDAATGLAIMRLNVDGTVDRIAPGDFFERPTSTSEGR